MNKLLLSLISLLSLSFTPISNYSNRDLSNTLIESSANYYLLGTFTDYQINEQYKLIRNIKNDYFNEYKIRVNLKTSDSFYVGDDKNNTFKNPDNNEFTVKKDALYDIYFAKNHDYGNKYNLKYNVVNNENDIEEIKINSQDSFINMINRCYTDSYSKNKIFNIENDIDLGGITINSIPIFCGTINGNNHRIYNFHLNTYYSGSETGFIRNLTKEGTIDSLNLEYDLSTNNEDTSIGGIVGINNGKIFNSTFLGKVKGINNVGGIVGINDKDGNIINCNNDSSIIGRSNLGGIAGKNLGSIDNSKNNGTINDTRFSSSDEVKVSIVGGIVGSNEGTITDCQNNSSVGTKQIGKNIGGIAGHSIGKISKCHNFSNVYGKTNIGGIAGYTTYKLIKNNSENLVSDKYSIETSINSGKINGENSVGGIVGYSNIEISQIVSENVNNIRLCFNDGFIECINSDVGGICGTLNKGTISDCFNTGIISSNDAINVGGIVGNCLGEIVYCFAINDINGNKNVGGIAGTTTKIHDCYTIANITSNGPFTGALVGYAPSLDNIYNNYYVYINVNGIDNIDYNDKSVRVSKYELASQSMLNVNLDNEHFIADKESKKFPQLRILLESVDDSDEIEYMNNSMKNITKFGSLVTFIANDSIVKRVFVEYNSDLDNSLIPPVPSKEGFFCKWEEFSNHNITRNIYVNAIYDEIIRSIANDKSDKYHVIVEGQFYNTTTVNLLYKNNGNAGNYAYNSSYQVNVNDEFNELDLSNIKIKLKLPKNMKKPLIGYMDNDEFIVIDSYVDGDYICFNYVDSKDFILASSSTINFMSPLFITLYIIIAISIIGLVVFLIIHCNKKKKLTDK